MSQNDIIEEVIEIPVNDADEKVGNVEISVDVVATIAGIATGEINGVAGMSTSIVGGLAEIFSQKKNPGRGVKVEIKDSSAIIDIYVNVDYGVRIPELSWEIQENVKNNVETMTGLTVEKVNIHVEGISFEKDKTAAVEPLSDDDENDDIIVEETIIDEIPEEGSEGL